MILYRSHQISSSVFNKFSFQRVCALARILPSNRISQRERKKKSTNSPFFHSGIQRKLANFNWHSWALRESLLWTLVWSSVFWQYLNEKDLTPLNSIKKSFETSFFSLSCANARYTAVPKTEPVRNVYSKLAILFLLSHSNNYLYRAHLPIKWLTLMLMEACSKMIHRSNFLFIFVFFFSLKINLDRWLFYWHGKNWE